MKDIKQYYFKKIDKYYYNKSNVYYNFNKIDYSNINNYCYYKDYKLSAGRLNIRYNLKSGRRLNKNYIQFLDYIKPIVLFNDIKKFKGRDNI